MDAYLESLVKKEEAAEEAATEEAIEEVGTEAEDAVEVVTAEVPEETVQEESDNAESESELTAEESTAELEEEAVAGPKEGDVIHVELIKVYKTPDVNQIAQNVTGNVTYLGKVGDFNIVSYMRHGFGIVKGYTLNDLR